MRIYQINTEHRRYGLNWGSQKIAARTAEEAIRLAKKEFISGERMSEVKILATTE